MEEGKEERENWGGGGKGKINSTLITISKQFLSVMTEV